MAVSTTAFGVYFYLVSQHGSGLLAADGLPADLAWLALTSMAVFITGEVGGHNPGRTIQGLRSQMSATFLISRSLSSGDRPCVPL